VVQLRKRHKDELFKLPVTDDEIRNSVKAFIGTAVHDQVAKQLFEHTRRHPGSGWMVERKIWDKIAGRKVVGKFDAYLNGMLLDLKTTSIWKFIYKQFDDFENQLNIYAYILRKEGIPVSLLQIVMWFTDYNANESYKHADYPQDFIEPVLISNLWPMKEAEERIVTMVERHKANEGRSDNELDLCTAEDMWSKESVWAVEAPGSNRAVRLLDTEAEAKDYITKSKNKEKGTWVINKRAGAHTRCEKFCKVNIYCSQYQQYLAENEGGK